MCLTKGPMYHLAEVTFAFTLDLRFELSYQPPLVAPTESSSHIRTVPLDVVTRQKVTQSSKASIEVNSARQVVLQHPQRRKRRAVVA